MPCLTRQPPSTEINAGIWRYMAVLTTRKQTYPFKTMAVGESFKVNRTKYNSMLTSWRQHNKNHPDKAIEIEAKDSSPGWILVTRVEKKEA